MSRISIFLDFAFLIQASKAFYLIIKLELKSFDLSSFLLNFVDEF